MDMTTLKIARWNMRRWMVRMTWPWLVTGGLLAFAAGFYLSMVQAAQSDVEMQRHRLHALLEESRIAEHPESRLKQLSTPKQLEAFYQFFPPERSIPDWIEKISNATAKNRLYLRQGEYQVVRDKSSKLLLYQVMLPVKGTYPNLRAFIDEVLTEVPIASLDNVKFERQRIGDDALVSTVMLTLHLRSET